MVKRYSGSRKMKIFYYSCLVSILLNFYLNLIFYPDLLEYQSGTKAANFANQTQPGSDIKAIGLLSYTIHFHSHAEVRILKSMAELMDENSDENYLLFTHERYLDSLEINEIKYDVLKSFPHYHITMLRGDFLNYKTRNKALQEHLLLEIFPAK